MTHNDRLFLGALLVICGLMAFLAGTLFGLIETCQYVSTLHTSVYLLPSLGFMLWAPVFGLIVILVGAFEIIKAIRSGE